MAFLVFALGLVLLVAGVAGGYMSLDLLPTVAGSSMRSAAPSHSAWRSSLLSSAS